VKNDVSSDVRIERLRQDIRDIDTQIREDRVLGRTDRVHTLQSRRRVLRTELIALDAVEEPQ